MRYKLLVCVFVLLIATPAFSQEFSPIIVETGKPTPNVVRSGEPFKVTYRAKFFDTVLIYEEQMQPDNLALEKIEVVALVVEPKEREYDDTLGFVNVWDFTYTFRIIQPEKGMYKIPSFNFIWVEKRAGVTEEEAKEKEKPREIPTDEVGVGYISVVRPADKVVKPPPLDIRDEINFVSPIADGVVLRKWAYSVIGIAFLLSAVITFRFSRKIRKSQEANREEVVTETPESDTLVDVEPILSPKQARKKFLRELNKLRGDNMLDLTKKIHLLVRTLLFAELRGIIRDSMSENEIYAKLSGLDAKQKKQIGLKYLAMIYMAIRLKDYQKDIDLGRCSLDILKEIVELKEVVSGLKFHKRVLVFVKRLVGVRR